MRFLSANLYRGRVLAEHLDDVLAEVGADVGVFQELTPALGEVVAHHYRHGALHPRPGASGLGIGSRRPVANDVLDLPDRIAPVATLEPECWPELIRPMRVLNVHMTHPMVFPPWRSLPDRSRQARRILEHTSGHDSLVLGDLNAAPGWPVYRRLGRSLHDAAHSSASTRGRRPEPTWSLRPSGRGLLRLDHVMARGVEVTDVFTVPLTGSDHRVVVADIAITRRDGAPSPGGERPPGNAEPR